jgi:curved DNA-binding protein CbpA
MPFKDHFQTLRLSHRATPQQVQKAYYDRLKFFHPDYFQDDPPRRAIAETETKCLNEAFEVLGKPGERERYITEWQRHQSPQRPPERSLAVEQSLADARADLSMARLQLSELKSLLDQRDRDLEAANLGMRQGYQRVTHLQKAAQSFEERARELQARLLERDQDVHESQVRAQDLERQLNRLQTEVDEIREENLQARHALGERLTRLAEGEREAAERGRELDLFQRKRESPGARSARRDTEDRQADEVPTGQTPMDELRRALVAGEEALRLRQAQLDERAAEVRDLRQSASVADERLREQQSLLHDAARQMRSLQERLELAEATLRRHRATAPVGAETAATADAESQSEKAQLQELAAALAQRTEEARQAQAVADYQKERLRILESAQRGQSHTQTQRGIKGRIQVAVDRAAGSLSPERATTVLTSLMLALCVLAVTLVLLTVSFDLPALVSGLGRLGAALGGMAPR